MNSIYHFIVLTLILLTHLSTNQSRDLNFEACNSDCDNEDDECYSECACETCNHYPYSGYCIGDKPCGDKCPDSPYYSIDDCDKAECDECATTTEENCLDSCVGDANGCDKMCHGDGKDAIIDCNENGSCMYDYFI
eukprot:8274_1